jgi:hypothetical protein
MRQHRSKWVKFWGVVVLGITTSAVAMGQPAADKATARQLATQGIQYYQQGKHADALDLLQRAEQLYDAPVHLIYIARTQAALGKLVEASETYRRLVRTDLAAGAPQAFKDAVADAQKELQQLEPKIPSLRIEVTPTDAKGLQLKLDGEVVSSVVIGINRPTNPGKHSVEAAAADFDSATASVELVAGGKQTVTLQMHPRPGAPAPVVAGAQAGTSSAIQPAAVGTPGAAGTARPITPVDQPATPFDGPPQIVIGARLLAASPGGKLPLGGSDAVSVNGSNNTEDEMKNRFGTGVGVLLSAGYRLPIGQQFALTPALAYEGYWFDKGPYYAQKVDSIIQNYAYANSGGTSSVLQVTPTARSVLLGGTIEFPRAQHSWAPVFYGELFAIVYHQLKTTGTVTTGNNTCQLSDTYTGSGIKVGGGLLLPASKIVRFAAGFGITAASASSRLYWDTCQRVTGNGIASTSIDVSGASKLHTLIGLNIGGDFMIGL